MRSQDVLPRLGTLLRPYVETVAGPLPDIEFRPADATRWQRDMCVFPDQENGHWYVRYDPESVDALLSYGSYGEVWHGITHELIHLVNCEAKRLALARDWADFKMATCAADIDPRDPWNRYTHWSEGTAELAALAVGLDIVERDLDKALFTEVFGVKSPKGLKRYLVRDLAELIQALDRSKRTSAMDLAALNLPFEAESVRKVVNQTLRKRVGQPQPHHILFMPYALGVWRCGGLVRASSMSLRQLLRAPMTNRQLMAAVA